jgi:hypothetical protein
VINDEISFQPNLRYGLNFIVAEWKTKITKAQNYKPFSQELENSQNSQNFALDIVLPFVYKINRNWDVGADICMSGASLEVTSGTGKYEFRNNNVFNIFFDYHL